MSATQKSFLPICGTKAGFRKALPHATELREVQDTLTRMLDLSHDRAHIFQLDPRMARDLLGRATAPVTDVFLIV